MADCAPVLPGLSVSAKHISGGMAGLGGATCVPTDLAKTQLQNQCGQETYKGRQVGAGVRIRVRGPGRRARLGSGLLTLASLGHLLSGHEDRGGEEEGAAGGGTGLGEGFKPERGSGEPEQNQPGTEQRLAPGE